MSKPTPKLLTTQLADGRIVPLSACSCAACHSAFFIIAHSDEWIPRYCPYCGRQFSGARAALSSERFLED